MARVRTLWKDVALMSWLDAACYICSCIPLLKHAALHCAVLCCAVQLAVYGKESMRRMATANVLICGLNGLGVETGGSYAKTSELLLRRRRWEPICKHWRESRSRVLVVGCTGLRCGCFRDEWQCESRLESKIDW